MQIGMEILSQGAELCAMQTTLQLLKLLFQKLPVRKVSAHFSISIDTSSMSIATDLLLNISAEQRVCPKSSRLC